MNIIDQYIRGHINANVIFIRVLLSWWPQDKCSTCFICRLEMINIWAGFVFLEKPYSVSVVNIAFLMLVCKILLWCIQTWDRFFLIQVVCNFASQISVLYIIIFTFLLFRFYRLVHQWSATKTQVHWTIVKRVNHDWLQLYSNNSLISSRLQEKKNYIYRERAFSPFLFWG
jgi:hypothetical protein